MKPHRSAFPTPPRELILSTPEHFIAFGFGAGLAPFAPGTFGTLAAVPLWFALFWMPWPAYVAALGVLFVFGCWACGASARLLGIHDYGGIVFDEIVGFLVAAMPLLPALHPPATWPWLWLAAAFALFRLFDIWKPWPIAAIEEKVEGGFGIMLDDVLAGGAAAAVLIVGQRVIY